MYLITAHATYFYRSVAALSGHQRMLLTISFLMAFLTVWYYGIYLVLNESVIASEREIIRLHEQLVQLADAQKTSKDLGQAIEQLKLEVASKSSAASVSQTVQKILDIAAKSGLIFEQYTVHDSIDKQWYRVQPVRFDFQAKLAAVTAFLMALSASSLNMQWGNCSLMGSQGNYRFSFDARCALLAQKN